MSRQLRMKDLKWKGTNSRRLKFEGNRYTYKVKFMEPVIDSDEFQFTLKIHWCRTNAGFNVGVCDVNHPKSMTNACCQFGRNGGIGWGWNMGYCVYGTNGFRKDLKETYGPNDLVTVSVNRNEKTIEFLKNKESMGKLENLDFPKDLVIAVAQASSGDVEVVEFSCKPRPPPPTREEVEIMMKEMEQRFMIEIQKVKEEAEEIMKLQKITQDRQIEELRKKNEELRVDSEELRKKFDSQNLQIEELRKKSGKHEELRLLYEEHFELYHRMIYSVKSSIEPQVLKKSDQQVNYCFENDTFRFRFDFSVQSGSRFGEEQNNDLNFEGLQIMLNGEPLSRFGIEGNTIELEKRFTKIGRNEVTCIFHNIKKTFVIDVEPISLYSDKCELLLYRAELEPNGDLTQSTQVFEKFSSEDIIQVVIKLVNENGIPLMQKFLEEEDLDVKLIKIEGTKKKKMKGVFSRELDICIDAVDEKGEFGVCSIGEDKLGKGKYEVRVDGCQVSVKKVFLIE